MLSWHQAVRRGVTASKNAGSVSQALSNVSLCSKIDGLPPHQIRMVFLNNEEMLLDPKNTRGKGDFIVNMLESQTPIEAYS